MKRRELLAGLSVGGMQLESQAHTPESLYIPKAHRVEDRKFLHDFMEEFPFADLATASPALRITHIPVLLDRDWGQYGKLHGHISKQNPQVKALEGQQSGVIVFRGPHSYISPSWYSKSEAVPTWNFAAVHAGGRLSSVTDKEALHDLLVKLVAKFEDREKSGYEFGRLPENFKYGLMGGIVGFEMEIELLEGKFKLGQERSAADREGILQNLQTARQGRSMYQFTADFYRRRR